MKKFIKFTFLIGFILLFHTSNFGQKFYEVTANDAGKSITLAKDQILTIKLVERPSSGYRWHVKSMDGGIMEYIDEADWTPLEQGLGAEGIRSIRFKAIANGTANLELVYDRPWEANSAENTFRLKVNAEAAYSGIEYKPVQVTYEPVPKYVKSNLGRAFPSKFSYIDEGIMTPVKDQGNCGSCWAFAGCGVFEALIKGMGFTTRDLSEQWFVNCDKTSANGGSNNGCSGGWFSGDEFKTKGAVYETDEPYQEANGTCETSYTYHEKANNYKEIGPSKSVGNTDSIKKYLYNYGPLWVACFAGSGSPIQNYNGTVITSNPSNSIDHAVVIVGWDDTGANPYWIVRNSWASSWGDNGYFKIAYGCCKIGYDPWYIDYGKFHQNIPPVVDLGAVSTSSCDGKIQFRDMTINGPTSWLWNFGDGTTSTLQNPSHTYTASGTYTVSLKATNSYGNDTKTKTSFITINLEASPSTTGASRNGTGSVTLSATGTGTLKWYDAATGGNLVNTGTTFATSALSVTTTYYVENDVPQPVQSAGMTAKTTNGGYYTSTAKQGLVFDAYVPLIINSVTVYANTTANRTIWLRDYNGTTIDSLVTSIASGTQSVTLNFNVPAGTGYTLGTNSNNSLWRDNTGAAFPYTVSNLISITGNTVPDELHYYYFYNWQVQQTPCISARVPVVATIIPAAGINEISKDDIELFPNPNAGSFDIKLKNQNYKNVTVNILNVLGEKLLEKKNTGNNSIHIDASGLQRGIYFVEIKTDKSTYLRKITITN